jgi:PLD-like domain/Helix-hairpin-helix motif
MNTMYRFEWAQVAVEPFLADLIALTNASAADKGEVASLLSHIFAGTGGSAFANSDWDSDHRVRVARKLLGEAIASTLTYRFHFQSRRPGVVTRDDHGELMAVGEPALDVNRASAGELEALPVIGPALAGRIVEKRRSGGYFVSMPDLLKRVTGLGDDAGERLQGVLAFSKEGLPLRPVIAGTLNDDLRALLALDIYAGGRERLAAGLEEVAMHVAAHPHPCARLGMKREDLEPESIAEPITAQARASQVKVLADKAYYPALLNLLNAATHRVDVCMFYVALPVPTHPTHQLLDALARRAAAGCAVRVLVDQDGKDDPYGSRLINAAAVAFLSSRGVETRGDATESLLHSKFIVIDDTLVVIGSHNWTAGSFFHYADVSVVISGQETNRLWHSRFESLWLRGRKFGDAGNQG